MILGLFFLFLIIINQDWRFVRTKGKTAISFFVYHGSFFFLFFLEVEVQGWVGGLIFFFLLLLFV